MLNTFSESKKSKGASASIKSDTLVHIPNIGSTDNDMDTSNNIYQSEGSNVFLRFNNSKKEKYEDDNVCHERIKTLTLT